MTALASCATEREIPENKSFSASAWLLPPIMLYLNQYYFIVDCWSDYMANPEHVKILKQGVEVWNKWRIENPDIEPKLSNVDLSGTSLSNVNLSGSDLFHSNLSSTSLIRANLDSADLIEVNLNLADLSGANLFHVNLMRANLNEAHLGSANLMHANLDSVSFSEARLVFADFRHANLSHANLDSASLNHANLGNTVLRLTHFRSTNLDSTNLESAICAFTTFVDIDFSTTKGLERIHHDSPSSLGIDTIFRSKGQIPEVFLRGCGVPEILIKYLPSMYEDAIQFYSCFISYSHDDKAFAQLLHDRLQGQGIRCWLDEHQLKPGDELHKTIYEGIRVYDKVILCCSEMALQSWWVEKEFKNAISKEEDYTETVLIPITLDDYLFKQSADNWTVGEIKRRFVQDFSNWKDHDAFEVAFKRVVDALRTDGGKPPPPASKLTRRKP